MRRELAGVIGDRGIGRRAYVKAGRTWTGSRGWIGKSHIVMPGLDDELISIRRAAVGYNALAHMILDRVPHDRIECVECLRRAKKDAYTRHREL